MKVWITKYALTLGIIEADAESTQSVGMIKLVGGRIHDYYHGDGKEWHPTREGAVRKAEEMRLKKIQSLQKQISRLTKLKFT